jgi:UDP-2,3-diacylglucosamine hydrolase
MTTLFISDLHLDEAKPAIGEQFLEFLDRDGRSAEALYILGDLFESWIGDDDPDPHYTGMKSALRRCVESGTRVYFMHGNRDFLVGEGFADETGAAILPDPCVVELYGDRVMLSHGDALCTDDFEYQQVRAMTRNPEWQSMMLSKSLRERKDVAERARTQSQARNAMLPEHIMDVNQEAVEQAMRNNGVAILLHGHTHRPAIHEFDLDGKPATRIVLGDWYDQGSVVRWDEQGFTLEALPRSP